MSKEPPSKRPKFKTVREMLAYLALANIVESYDKSECYCGTPPYDDGTSCPLCFAIDAKEIIDLLDEKENPASP